MLEILELFKGLTHILPIYILVGFQRHERKMCS